MPEQYKLSIKPYFNQKFNDFFNISINDIGVVQKATKLQLSILSNIENIVLFPESRPAIDKQCSYRLLYVYPYTILYRIDKENNIIKLLAIFHSHMRIANLFNKLKNREKSTEEVSLLLKSEDPQIQTEQLRQAFAEFGCDYDEANKEYLAEATKQASMSETDKLIEYISSL